MSVVVGPYDEDEVPDLKKQIAELEEQLAESEARNTLLIDGMTKAFDKINELEQTVAAQQQVIIRTEAARKRAEGIFTNPNTMPTIPMVGDPYTYPKGDKYVYPMDGTRRKKPRITRDEKWNSTTIVPDLNTYNDYYAAKSRSYEDFEYEHAKSNTYDEMAELEKTLNTLKSLNLEYDKKSNKK